MWYYAGCGTEKFCFTNGTDCEMVVARPSVHWKQWVIPKFWFKRYYASQIVILHLWMVEIVWHYVKMTPPEGYNPWKEKW